ncbi:MAG: hypothetical protein RLZZ15_10 [Verrucomicrobiota bacterium]|jgi:hypothetical protein
MIERVQVGSYLARPYRLRVEFEKRRLHVRRDIAPIDGRD